MESSPGGVPSLVMTVRQPSCTVRAAYTKRISQPERNWYPLRLGRSFRFDRGDGGFMIEGSVMAHKEAWGQEEAAREYRT